MFRKARNADRGHRARHRGLARINTEIGTIQLAVVDGELGAAAAAAERLRATLADVQPLR